jgi:hypothetical protein
MRHGLPEELRALCSLVPGDVEIIMKSADSFEIRCTWVEEGSDGHSTSSRWMSPHYHSLQEWADAIIQVRRRGKLD